MKFLVTESVHLLQNNGYSEVLGRGKSPSTDKQWKQWGTWWWKESIYCTTVDTVRYLVMERVHLLHYNGYSEVLDNGKSPSTALQWLQWITSNIQPPESAIQMHSCSQLIFMATKCEWKVLRYVAALCSNSSLVWHQIWPQTPSYDRQCSSGTSLLNGLRTPSRSVCSAWSNVSSRLCHVWVRWSGFCLCLDDTTGTFHTAHSDCRQFCLCNFLVKYIWALVSLSKVQQKW